MLARLPLAVSLLLTLAPQARAQTEADLKRHFEGKRVTLRIDMPGTEQGVDIYPGTERPLDYPRYADRLKDHGTAIEAGDNAMVTKIRVKSSHIEFQLDGGGYGTMGDETSSSVYVETTPKSTREKNLEAELKREKDKVEFEPGSADRPADTAQPGSEGSSAGSEPVEPEDFPADEEPLPEDEE